jgi:hypothetical protein
VGSWSASNCLGAAPDTLRHTDGLVFAFPVGGAGTLACNKCYSPAGCSVDVKFKLSLLVCWYFAFQALCGVSGFTRKGLRSSCGRLIMLSSYHA